jgi:replication-associated recombination protein RarA
MVYQTKKHQYNDDEVVSALQKSIRRGIEEDAYYFALEICDGGEHKVGFSRLYNRLKTIIYEDIGLGHPEVVLQGSKAIDDMKEIYDNNKDGWRIILGYIILLLCRSCKSRIADNFNICMEKVWDNEKIEMPDYALDYHTGRGNKILGRTKYSKKGIEHFITEGEKLRNESVELKDNYREIAHQIRKHWFK